MNALLKSDHPDLQEISGYARQLTRRRPWRSFEKVIALGALYNQYGVPGFSPRDKVWLKSGATACHDLNINWADTFTVQHPNIAVDETDFLDPASPIKGDFLIVCLAPTPECAEQQYNRCLNLGEDPAPFRSSPFKEKHFWRAAAQRSDVKMIVTHSYGTTPSHEIEGKDFTSDDFILWQTVRTKTNLLTSYSRDSRTHAFKTDVVLRRDLHDEIVLWQRASALEFG